MLEASYPRPPRPRPDATLRDRALADSRDQLTQWLRAAITKGVIGGPWEGEFPRYAWYKQGDTVYEARLVNRTQGTYKGYVMSEKQSIRCDERLCSILVGIYTPTLTQSKSPACTDSTPNITS